MRGLCTPLVSCTVINGQWEDEEEEDEEIQEGKVETRPVCDLLVPSEPSTSPSLHPCLPLSLYLSLNLLLFFQWAVWQAASSNALSAMSLVNSHKLLYLSELPLNKKKKFPLSKWLKMIFNSGDSQGYGEFRQWANGNKVPHLHIFMILYSCNLCLCF